MYNSFEKDGFLYIVLEYVENGNLFEYMQQKEVKTEQALSFFRQVTVAVAHLHKQNILHRDVKPENVLVKNDGCVKLCDFGFCAPYGVDVIRRTMCGTTEYLPPEILLGATQNNKVDIWCLGVLLYELLHKRTPFDSRSDNQLLVDQNKQRIRFDDTVSKEIRELISGCLKVDPKERMTAEEILRSSVFSNKKNDDKEKKENRLGLGDKGGRLARQQGFKKKNRPNNVFKKKKPAKTIQKKKIYSSKKNIEIKREILQPTKKASPINKERKKDVGRKKEAVRFVKQPPSSEKQIYTPSEYIKPPKELIYSNASFKRKKDPAITKLTGNIKKTVIRYSANRNGSAVGRKTHDASNSPGVIKVTRKNSKVKKIKSTVQFKSEMPNFYLNKDHLSQGFKYKEPNKGTANPISLNGFNIYKQADPVAKDNIYNFGKSEKNLKKVVIGKNDFGRELGRKQFKYSCTQGRGEKGRAKKSSFHYCSRPREEGRRRVINLDEVTIDNKGKRSSSLNRGYIGGSLNLRWVKR